MKKTLLIGALILLVGCTPPGNEPKYTRAFLDGYTRSLDHRENYSSFEDYAKSYLNEEYEEELSNKIILATENTNRETVLWHQS